jgi:predicted DNA-binding protein YlxM (UPF0122 family)
VAEAADILDISVEAVRDQIKRGTLVFMQKRKI